MNDRGLVTFKERLESRYIPNKIRPDQRLAAILDVLAQSLRQFYEFAGRLVARILGQKGR